ncbi:TPA: efflux RND transporter permease subunit [Legionella pneumophila]|uniref:Cation efflux system protein cusA n=2 Tax=Legionella TaxID=445 RepID=A0A378PG83_9GAMM|nr:MULTISPECIES: efflux RND transporter permease subunit [Legionella]KTD70649.1 Cation efflux system protein cusA [Legionella steigerwaltii]MCL9684049.1 efflux RND transporter permease subunit [Legionella maioricensis]MCL9687044.1 efflux RND transporter permease subunit [Legionella maioricensis]RJT65032.1 CusA/CzcA family heavy metal efflux RND transporter [Legionella taurinensis]RYV83315.1 CusA/CzcA family heavy metal efflux RND transporter [Legionella pneumophila]
MIAAIIRWSIKNRFLIVLMTGMLILGGIYTVKHTVVDAIPDLSDVQVIIKTEFPGQAPQIVEDQVTYPLTTAMLAVPGAVTVRGESGFGVSYVYVIFQDGVDLYWARSRVLEYLSQITNRLPLGAQPTLGPDATGVGWVYEYALVDRTGTHDLAQLTSLQNWFLKYELQKVPGVAEVATAGGMVKQYQITLDPDRLRAYGLTLQQVKQAVVRSNREAGGSAIEMGEAEYMIRAKGYLKSIKDMEQIPVGLGKNGIPILLQEVAQVQLGPQMRRGITELNGQGEAVGGIIVMRFGQNAMQTIANVKEKLKQLQASLPKGVEISTTYDRSSLIQRAINTLQDKLIEEFIVVSLICIVFLFHFRSSLIIVISLPIGILLALMVMHLQGINANIMSLGGIAIAIGAMVDAAIVMIENAHKHLEHEPLTEKNRWHIMQQASLEVGPPLFFSLLIITISFLPVFSLQAQEGRLFAPLAYTKTYAMAAAALLSITLVPVLMGYFIRGKIKQEHENPINRMLLALYQPVLYASLKAPKMILALAALIVFLGFLPLHYLGNEFMPELDEGDLLYMPTTFPGISIGKAQQLLQQTDKLIATVPEVKTVFGKIGRAETATDPAPLSMVETTIQFKPHNEWRPGMTMDKLREELSLRLKLPGLSNAWVMPIKTRIDMLATGIKTPVGIKIAGPDLNTIQSIGEQLEIILKKIPGTTSVFAERVASSHYITIDIDRLKAARYGLNVEDIQEIIETTVGGMNVTQTIEGRERYPVNLRYPRDLRDSLEKLRLLPIVTPMGATIPLSEIASLSITEGPDMIRSENARLNGWVYIDIAGRDLGSYVKEAQDAVQSQVKLPAGYSLTWSGQYEYLERAKQRLSLVAPLTLAIIAFLLYLNFGRLAEVLIILGTLPLALVGGIWLLYLLGYHLSVAVGIGFIALAGVAAETGVIMLVFLNQALEKAREEALQQQRALTRADVFDAVVAGALLRLRPKIMTVTAIIGGLLPIMLLGGTGSEVMRRIAAPMVGGMLSATVLTLIVIPVIYLLWQQRKYNV